MVGDRARSATSAATRAVAPGSSAINTCSWSACAPPPTAPRPSRVGVPTPAVKLPSDPPPTAAAVNGGRPEFAREHGGPVEQPRRRVGRQRRAVEPARHVQPGSGQHGPQRAQGGVDPLLLRSVANAHVDGELARGGHGVGRGAGRGERRRDRRAPVGPAQRRHRQQLVRQLQGRVDAALRLEAGVRGPPGHPHLVQRDALALGLERAAVGRRLQHQRRARTPPPPPR